MPPETSVQTITVRGDAAVRAEPDEAVLSITLTALEDRPGAALSDVSARSDALVALLDELGIAKRDRSTTGISVEEEFDHTEKGVGLGHRATARLSVRLADAELLGRLVAQATEDLAARIDGLRWSISLDNPARLEAARRAAVQARRKSEAYAEGIGARLGRLIGLGEPGTQLRAVTAMARMPAATSYGAMPVEAGEHEVGASIEATFALELD